MKKEGPTDRLKKVRIQLNLTQQELADELGVSRSSIANYESGIDPISRKFARKLEKKYGISARWLLSGEEKDGAIDSTQEVAVVYSDQGGVDEIRISDMLQKTAEVLESKTIFRSALASNINAFYQAVKTEEPMRQLRDRMEAMELSLSSQMKEVVRRLECLEEENGVLKKELASREAQDQEDLEGLNPTLPPGDSPPSQGKLKRRS